MLEKLQIGLNEKSGKVFSIYLSSVISLAINLLPKNNFTQEDIVIMKKILLIDDKRIIANIVDVFIYFDVREFSLSLKGAEKIFNNRIQANLLVREGFNDLNKKVLKGLKKMIQASDPLYIASGLYALGELAKYYREKNIVYFSTNTKLQKMLINILNFIVHENEMVARQALRAAKKVDNEEMNMKIKSIYNETALEPLKKSIKDYFFS